MEFIESNYTSEWWWEAEVAGGAEQLRSHGEKFKSTWELLFISHHGQAAGGHGDWLEQESREACEWA